jgi:N-methylhydantoinase A
VSDAKADASDQHASYRVGVDIGGTFTDLILVETASGAITVGKSLTTPTDPSEAVETVLTDALTRSGVDAGQVEHIIHGTTLVTNSLIERKGSKTALLTTRGFRDAVEIGREHRYDLYDVFLEMPKPLVPRYLRLEVDERVLASGEVVRPPDLEDLEPLVRELQEKGIEAIAVSLLHSYANPTHERQVADLIAKVAPEIRVSISSDVVPEIREYERASTTSANVYVAPLMARYLEDLERRMSGLGVPGPLYIMQSSGGIALPPLARRHQMRRAVRRGGRDRARCRGSARPPPCSR